MLISVRFDVTLRTAGSSSSGEAGSTPAGSPSLRHGLQFMNSDTLYCSIAKYRDSDVVALYFREGKITFRKLLSRIDEMADRLYGLGVRKESVVSLLSPNVPEAIVVLYALSKIGAKMSLLHPLLPKEVLRESLEETKTDFFIVLDVLYPTYQDIEGLSSKTYFISACPDLNPVVKLGFKFLYRKDLRHVDPARYLFAIPALGLRVITEDLPIFSTTTMK